MLISDPSTTPESTLVLLLRGSMYLVSLPMDGKKFLEDNYLLSDLVDKEFSDYKSLVKKN